MVPALVMVVVDSVQVRLTLESLLDDMGSLERESALDGPGYPGHQVCKCCLSEEQERRRMTNEHKGAKSIEQLDMLYYGATVQSSCIGFGQYIQWREGTHFIWPSHLSCLFFS